MESIHRIFIQDSRRLSIVQDESCDLVVTSPPYPMIEMWDELFSSLSSDVKTALSAGDGMRGFEAMHAELDKTWNEVARVLKPGSIACINIGDATRTIAERFRLYSNHSRIIRAFVSLGFDTLPVILWRKQTNAPNKFMGSGMLPAGAYVTLEHEYILVFRKGEKRKFSTEIEKSIRRKSAYFWEERNAWFSDVWEKKGAGQPLDLPGLRLRSAAFPLELPYRLINMFSVYGDAVLDPFAGTGTTMLAAIASGRNSISVEIDPSFAKLMIEGGLAFGSLANEIIEERVAAHNRFIEAYTGSKGKPMHANITHGFPVVTGQETRIELFRIADISRDESSLRVEYEAYKGSALKHASNRSEIFTQRLKEQPDLEF